MNFQQYEMFVAPDGAVTLSLAHPGPGVKDLGTSLYKLIPNRVKSCHRPQ